MIMPLLSGPRMLFNRNILYTAVTRAKKCVAIVGDEHTVRHMIENEKQQKRYTLLFTHKRDASAAVTSFSGKKIVNFEKTF